MRLQKYLYALVVVVALAAGGGIYWFQSTTDARALAGKKSVSVLTAARDLPAGTAIQTLKDRTDLTLVRYPVAALPPGAIVAGDEVAGEQIFTRDMAKGQLILKADLGSKVSQISKLQVPAGKSAVTVNLAPEDRVASFLQASSVVNVYASNGTSTRLLMGNVLVLAVGEAAEANLVTVALTPVSAQRLVEASKTGTITLALLSNLKTVP